MKETALVIHDGARRACRSVCIVCCSCCKTLTNWNCATYSRSFLPQIPSFLSRRRTAAKWGTQVRLALDFGCQACQRIMNDNRCSSWKNDRLGSEHQQLDGRSLLPPFDDSKNARAAVTPQNLTLLPNRDDWQRKKSCEDEKRTFEQRVPFKSTQTSTTTRSVPAAAADGTGAYSGATGAHTLQESKTPRQLKNRGDSDSLLNWMRDRQNAFRDFQTSFHPEVISRFDRDHPFPTRGSLRAERPELRDRLQDFSLFNKGDRWEGNSRRFQFDDSLDRDGSYYDMLSTRRSSQDEALKARVTYDEGKFQVEFEVQQFRPEELSIKTEGDVLVVMAKHEAKSDEGGKGGSYVSKQFEQRFTLPSGVKPEEITSALSKNGVLTVSAPRQVARKTSIGSFNKTRGTIEETYIPQINGGEHGLPHPEVKYDDDRFQISLDCKRYKPEELDVKVEELNTVVITARQEIKETGGTRTRVYEQKFTLPSGVKAEKLSSSLNSDGLLTITAPRGNASASSINQTIEERLDRVMAPTSWDATDARRQSSTSTSVSSTSNNINSELFDREFGERSLFQHSEALDNTDGVSRVQYDNGKYRIFVNVKNFKPEDLVIKTIGHSVQVDAKHLEKTADGHSYSSRSFSQTFSLPADVNPEAVTSSLTREGQLIIEAPLPQPTLKGSSERLVPIKHY